MAIQDFEASWVDIYNNSGGWSKVASNHPVQSGGGARYHSFIRIPEAVKSAIRSSTTPAKLTMRMYVTTGAKEIDVGSHKTSSARGMGASGLPWYGYRETIRNIGTGWYEYGMSSWFMPNFLSGNTMGVVLYNTLGIHMVATGKSGGNYIRFRVEGTWNTPPTNPGNPRLNKTVADTNVTLSFNASADKEQAQSALRYDIDFYNGSSWSRVSTRQAGLSHRRDTTKDKAVTNGRFRVRAFDGELYSGWSYSPYFTIKHVAPSFSASQVSYLDTNPITVGITGNNQFIVQTASTVRVNILSAASANEDKTIREYTATLSGQEKRRSTVGALDFAQIDAGSDQTLTVTVTDSAGMTTSITKTIKVLSYTPPKLVYNAKRQGSISDETDLNVSGEIGSLRVSNVEKNALVTTRYRYREKGGGWSSWLNFVRTVSGNSFTANKVVLNLDNTKSWEIEINVSDKVSSRSVIAEVRSGKPIMFVDERLEGVGIGMYPTKKGLSINDPIYVNGVDITQANDLPSGKGDLEYWKNLPIGTYRVTPTENVENPPSNYAIVRKTGNYADWIIEWSSQRDGAMYRRAGNPNSITDWVVISEMNTGRKGTVLWSGGAYLNGSQTLNLPVKIKDCPNGWLILWSKYEGGDPKGWDLGVTLIPKEYADHFNKNGIRVLLGYGDTIISKYIYVTNDSIRGNDVNQIGNSQNIVARRVVVW